jgi:hypothetical protein
MEYTNNELLATLGFWGSLLMTLIIFSGIAGDHALARLGQHLLVGASVGYMGVLAIQHVLRPRLITPLLNDPTGDPLRWVPLSLGLLLMIAGLDRTLRPVRSTAPPLWRQALHGLGRLPVALLLAVGLSAGLFGALQGTLLPQFWRAAQTAFDPGVSMPIFLAGVLTLLITTATLLYLYVDPARYLAEQPVYIRRLLDGWLWIGQRALWLAAGVIFARLMASRLSLLIARLDTFIVALSTTPFWQWWTGRLP